jgi:hypothetical protein
MAVESGFSRRRRLGRGRDAGDPQPAPTTRAEIPSRVAPREAFDVARYVTDMSAQLEAMAIAARLDLLAYFLGMAKAEGDLFLRTHAGSDGATDESAEPGAVDPVSDNDQDLD